MLDVLLANETLALEIALYGAIMLGILWETLAPRRPLTCSTAIRWLNNAGIWLVNTTLQRWLMLGLVVSVAVQVEQRGWGLLQYVALPLPVAMIVGLLLMDFLAYLKHVLFHKVPLLWRLHVVHHSDLDCDVSTSLRFHPLDVLLDGVLSVMIVVAVGAPAGVVLVFSCLVLSLNAIRHANVGIPMPLETVLRRFVITPDFHRVHHSTIRRETDSNYGVIFPWWDWMLKTYVAEPENGHGGMTIGLEYFRDGGELWMSRLLTQPFRRVGADAPVVEKGGSAGL